MLRLYLVKVSCNLYSYFGSRNVLFVIVPIYVLLCGNLCVFAWWNFAQTVLGRCFVVALMGKPQPGVGITVAVQVLFSLCVSYLWPLCFCCIYIFWSYYICLCLPCMNRLLFVCQPYFLLQFHWLFLFTPLSVDLLHPRFKMHCFIHSENFLPPLQETSSAMTTEKRTWVTY